MPDVVVVVGSRNFRNLKKVDDRLYEFVLTNRNVTIRSGGAYGVDQRAIEAAKKYGLPHDDPFLPAFKTVDKPYDVGDYHRRNDKMIDDPDVVLVIIFWDGKSPGSRSVIKKCMDRGYDHEVHFDR